MNKHVFPAGCKPPPQHESRPPFSDPLAHECLGEIRQYYGRGGTGRWYAAIALVCGRPEAAEAILEACGCDV